MAGAVSLEEVIVSQLPGDWPYVTAVANGRPLTALERVTRAGLAVALPVTAVMLTGEGARVVVRLTLRTTRMRLFWVSAM